MKALFSNQSTLLVDHLREKMIGVASVNVGKLLHAIAVRLRHAIHKKHRVTPSSPKIHQIHCNDKNITQ